MRVLLLVDCYLPSHKSSAKLIHDLGVEFQSQAHEVTVLTPSDQVQQDIEISMEDGLRVVRARTPRIKGVPKALRAVQEARLSGLVWQRAGHFLRKNPSDLIVFYSPTIFWSGLVRRLKSVWNCPAYLILRDIFPKWAVDAGLLRRGLIYHFFRRREMQQYACADVIGVQSPGDLKHFSDNGVPRGDRVEVLYNWTAAHEDGLPKTAHRAQLGLKGKVVFFYGGTLGVAQDVDNIVRLALGLVNRTDIRFLLVGGGTESSRLRRMLAEKALGNVLLLPSVDQREYLSMVSEFDVGLISLDRRLTTHNIPGKLLGYLYWGLPVLASVNPGNDLSELIQQTDVGFSVENGDDIGLQNAALQLATNQEMRARMGRNARTLLSRRFSAEAAVRQILSSISATAAPRRN